MELFMIESTRDPAALKLLDELGLTHLESSDAVKERISTLNMRQLDRLKLTLVRVSANNPAYSEETKAGIRRNDYGALADAALILASDR